MKELSIEEKAKAYDKAIERAKMSYHTGDYDKDTLEMLEIIFPELKESEDERIRKAAIEFVRQNKSFNCCLGISKEDAIAWLEKQGFQKPTDNEIKALLRTEYEKGRADAIAEMQNPAWSEEDEEFLRRAINATKDAYPMTAKWLKSLRPQNKWKPSDEQMKALSAMNVTGGISYAGQEQELINLFNDLKKLKE